MDQTHPPNKTRTPLILLLAGLILLPCILYIGLRVVLPGDGTSLGFEMPPATLGLPLSGLDIDPPQPATDLKLIAIGDRSVNEILSGLLAHPFSSDIPPADRDLVYRVSSNGNLQQVNVHLERQPFWPVLFGSWSFFASLLLLLLVSFLVFLRRPELPATRVYFLLSCLIFSSGVIFFIGIQASDLLNGAVFWLWILGILPLYGLLVGAFVHFALVFPVPRRIVHRKPWLILAAYLVVWVPYILIVGLLWQTYPSPGERLQVLVQGTGLISLTGFPLGLIIAILGYLREFTPRERRQTRWVLWGSLVAIVPWLTISILPALVGRPVPDMPLIGILWWAIPFSTAIAILRENLFSIDKLINRTIVYSLLTVLLALLYFIDVTILQNVFTAISGEQSTAAIVISTLVIAALFNPLRRRLQNIIDRRFYRKKYDAEKALAEFALSAREEVDLESLSESLLAVVEETIQPESASLWLNGGT